MKRSTISATDAARTFSEVLNKVCYQNRVYIVTRGKQPDSAVLTANTKEFKRVPGLKVVAY